MNPILAHITGLPHDAESLTITRLAVAAVIIGAQWGLLAIRAAIQKRKGK